MQNSKLARMTLDEKRLAREMHFERGLAPSRVEIATTHAGRCLLSRRLEGICEAEIELKPPMAGCLHAAGGGSDWLCRRS